MNILNKKILRSRDRFFALDISDLSVKLLQLEKRDDLVNIRSYAIELIESGCIEDGKIINKERVAELIKLTMRKAKPGKINTRKVVCSLPESKVFLRIVSVPKMEASEVGEAIKWEMEASIPLTQDQVYFDWQFLDEQDNKQEVLLVAVSRDTVDAYMETLSLAGLEVYGLEVESIASVRSLIPRDVSYEDSYLIVDLGAKATNFIITEGNIPYFTSSIPFSSEGLTDVISKSMGISIEEAEELKVIHGMEHSFSDNAIFHFLKPSLEYLSAEIEKSMEFYKSMSKRNVSEIKNIILCGSGANLKGLISYLSTRLKREVLMGDPWINADLGNNLPPISREESVRFSVAIGLSLKSSLWK